MNNANYKLQMFKSDEGVWTAILQQRARTTVELEAADLRELLKEIAELILFREESPIRKRLDATKVIGIKERSRKGQRRA